MALVEIAVVGINLVEIAAAGINATVLLGFYVWIRSHLMRLNREVGELKAWENAVETRCSEHNEKLGRLFDKVDEVKDIVASNDTATAKAIAHMTGKVDVLIQKGQDL